MMFIDVVMWAPDIIKKLQKYEKKSIILCVMSLCDVCICSDPAYYI